MSPKKFSITYAKNRIALSPTNESWSLGTVGDAVSRRLALSPSPLRYLNCTVDDGVMHPNGYYAAGGSDALS